MFWTCSGHMIRIRRFEDKCAELYTQQKIRGFLHLYDGEEAIAAGVIPVLTSATTGSSPPIASTATRWCAACR
jgi:TPP-dependent pyruvate/acetoin dehydrogenase alpha subunit